MTCPPQGAHRLVVNIDGLAVGYNADGWSIGPLDLELAPGEMVAIIGPSGAGKSTLLGHIAGLVQSRRRRGTITVLGEPVQHADGRISHRIRKIRKHIGFIFQQFNLVGQLSVMTNVLTGALADVPLWRAATGRFSHEQHRAAEDALRQVGLETFGHRRASTLSGGEQQRVAIARALVQGAGLILGDEPVASLDPETGRRIFDLLKQINQAHGTAMLVSLHQIHFAFSHCDRIIALREGSLVYDGDAKGLAVEDIRSIYGASSEDLLSPDPISQEHWRPPLSA